MTTVYLIENVQSGCYKYSAYEQESCPSGIICVSEIDLEDVPEWAMPQVLAELKEIER